MAVDEVNSVYVGGLPYEANEEMLRDAFGYYGTIVSVKVINDHSVKGKCYGFVTFTHPRAAEQAIAGMDGKKLGNRIVRVNEVRTRGPRDFGRDGFRRDPRSRPKGRDSRDLSSSSDDLQNDGKHQLDKTIQMREDLENEVNQIKDKISAKEQHIADLQKKAQKLEDELVVARKVSSGRQLAVTDLYKHFLQLQDYNDRVKTAEQRLQSLVDAAMVELDMAEDATTRDGSMYENGVV
ncbi:uncharacterized protein [Miscanthus floridulus]|uniref:uncharacterized protein isoform X3 n=1 Tax=Miscanthus floridulus TaxID=154761 RepID=UPI003457A5C1